MTAQVWVSIALAAISLVALYFTRVSAKTAKRQADIQEKIAQDAAQPYVWADLRPDTPQGGLLQLVVGNAGPTVATNVRVSIDPPVLDPINHHVRDNRRIFDRLSSAGIASLAPGREIHWSLGAVQALYEGGEAPTCRIDVAAVGPYGPVGPLSYDVNLEDIRLSAAGGDGSLRLVSKSIDEVAKALKALRRS